MASKRYQVRDRRRRSVGTFSTEDILRKIADGVFTGDEQIAAEGTVDWQDIASHPKFYDACLKRLYTKAYKIVDDPASRGSEDAPPKATRVVSDLKTVMDPEAAHSDDLRDSKTRQANPADFGGTAQFSEFDSLFSDLKEKPAAKSEPLKPIDAPAISNEDLVSDPLLGLFGPETPLQLGNGVSDAIAPSPDPTKEKTRRMLMGAAAFGLLLGLYVIGGSGSKDVDTGSDISFSTLKNADEKTRANSLRALKSEAQDLARSDIPLFYQGAVLVLKTALELDDKDPEILGLLAETGAYSLAIAADPDTRIGEVRDAIQRGRLKDPHATIFYRAEARVAMFKGDLAAAKQAALNAAETDPTSPENYLLVGELHYLGNDASSARSAIEEAVRLMPTSVRAQYYAARIAYDQGDRGRAKFDVLEALKLNPLHPPSYVLLGRVSEDGGQTPEAKGLFETAARLGRFATKEMAAEAYVRLARLETSGGEQAIANQHFGLARFYSKETADRMKTASASVPSGEHLKTLRSQEYGAEYFKEQGSGLISQHKYREAERFLQAASLLEPKDGGALMQLADVAEKTAQSYEDYQKVVIMYERALERDPHNAAAFWRLGTLETDQFNFDRALKLLYQAMALAPKRFEPYAALGKHYFKRQDYKEAISYFSQAEKLNPSDSEVHYYAGMIRLLYGSDGAKDAQVIFYKAYTLDPQNYDALVQWLKLRVAAFDKTTALQFVNRLIEEDPQNANLFWALGEIYSANKEFRKAIGYYHQALDLDNRSSRVRMSLAKALEAIGELEKAVAEYRLASRLDRRNSDGFFKAAEILVQAKNLGQAEEILKFLLGVTPNYPGAQRLLSRIYQMRNDKEGALAAMEKEVAANPENYRFILELSELYLIYEKYDAAVEQLTKVANLPATAKAPEFLYDKIRAYLLLSRAYRAQNRPDSAESTIHLALSIDGNDPELHRELGYVYYAQHRDKEGVKEFELYLNRNPAAREADAVRSLMRRMVIEE